MSRSRFLATLALLIGVFSVGFAVIRFVSVSKKSVGQDRQQVIFDNDIADISFAYPNDWKKERVSTSTVMLFSAAASDGLAAGDVETPSDITVSLLENLSGLSLSEFVATYKNGWYANYKKQYPLIVNGRSAIIADDSASMAPSRPTLAAFIVMNGKIALVTSSTKVKTVFDSLLKSLTVR